MDICLVFASETRGPVVISFLKNKLQIFLPQWRVSEF